MALAKISFPSIGGTVLKECVKPVGIFRGLGSAKPINVRGQEWYGYPMEQRNKLAVTVTSFQLGRLLSGVSLRARHHGGKLTN